ncbi:MAG: hypothetical protein ABEJ64_01445 [Candidatus Nanohaloarchaea archaeon]
MNPSEVLFWPITALIVAFLAIIIVFFVPQMTVDATQVTRAETSATEAQAALSASMKAENGVMNNYDRISYTASGRQKPIDSRQVELIAANFPYFAVKTRDGQDVENIFERGTKTGRRKGGTYGVELPARGGETVRLIADYEVLG